MTETGDPQTRTLIAIGSYTDPDEARPGLTTWWWDGELGLAPAGSADLESPSYTSWHPELPVLYAVSELDHGVVTALEVAADGALTQVAQASTGGAAPCWVSVDPTGSALLIANYGSGSMAVVPLDAAGRPAGEATVMTHDGSGPIADRQASAHVHQVVPTAEGTVLAADLGTDELVEYRVRGAEVARVGAVSMPAGCGPRHVALAADGITGFVVGELDSTVTTIRRSGARGDSPWRADGQVPSTLRTDVPRDRVYPSQILLAEGDRWLLVANRGTDSLAVLDVADGLTIRHEVETGTWVRHFAIVGDAVLLGCERADIVELLRLDAATGEPRRVGVLDAGAGSANLRRPTCVAVSPR